MLAHVHSSSPRRLQSIPMSAKGPAGSQSLKLSYPKCGNLNNPKLAPKLLQDGLNYKTPILSDCCAVPCFLRGGTKTIPTQFCVNAFCVHVRRTLQPSLPWNPHRPNEVLRPSTGPHASMLRLWLSAYCLCSTEARAQTQVFTDEGLRVQG